MIRSRSGRCCAETTMMMKAFGWQRVHEIIHNLRSSPFVGEKKVHLKNVATAYGPIPHICSGDKRNRARAASRRLGQLKLKYSSLDKSSVIYDKRRTRARTVRKKSMYARLRNEHQVLLGDGAVVTGGIFRDSNSAPDLYLLPRLV